MHVRSQDLQLIGQARPADCGFHGCMCLSGQLTEEVTELFYVIAIQSPLVRAGPLFTLYVDLQE